MKDLVIKSIQKFLKQNESQKFCLAKVIPEKGVTEPILSSQSSPKSTNPVYA